MENKNIKVLGEFLKSRRAKVSPDGLHISTGSRKRRIPGLRREEVAYLSGVSNTWYTWLEQGRDVNVSKEVLVSIANTLQLNEEEQRHIFRLAGYPVFTSPQPIERVINRELQLVIDSISYPTFVLEQSPEFAGWWQEHPLKQKSEIRLSIRSIDGKSIIHYHIVSFFQINGEANVHCCVYTPVDDTNNLAIYQKNKTNLQGEKNK